MGQVIPIASTTAVDEAWEAYRAHVAQEFVNPKLALDREHMTKRSQLHARFYRLIEHKACGNVVPGRFR